MICDLNGSLGSRQFLNVVNERTCFTSRACESIILKNFKLLQNDPDTGRIFSQPPLISFKRDKNIGNFLVRSAFKTSEQPGTFKCARARCKTCPFIYNVEKPHTTHNSLIRSDEGLTLETSASESLYGGQFTLSTQLIEPNYFDNVMTEFMINNRTDA